MLYIFKAFGGLFKLLGKAGKFLPVGMAGIFVVTQFFIDWFKVGFAYAFSIVAKTVFAAELVINEKVHMAIANAQGYNLIDIIQILIALYIFYALIKFFTRLQVKISGAQAEWGAAFISLLIVGIIEISAVTLLDGGFGFVPYWNGIIFLAMNLPIVFSAAFTAGTTNIVPIAQNITQNVSNNATIMSLFIYSIFFKKKDI